jgi:hypothetical protein
VTVAAVTVLATLATLVSGTGTAGATESHPTSVTPDGSSPTPSKDARFKSLAPPYNMSVTTSETGFTVYATPSCSGYSTCRTWFAITEMAIDHKDVTTTNGYFVPWPSTWVQGRTIDTGLAHSYGRDILGWGYSSAKFAWLPPITRPFAERGLTARLTRQDDSTRTAYISGTASPWAVIRRNGVDVAAADGNGSWSTSVAGLPLGTSTLTFEQFINNAVKDRASVSVTFTAKDLFTGVTGETTTLPAGTETIVDGQLRAISDVSAPLTGAKVVFTAPQGTTFPADLSTVRGQYRAATGGGWKDFASDNLVDGVVSADGRTATFTWTTPADGWSLPSGTDVRFGVPVTNPGTAPGDGQLTMTAVGSAPGGSFDTAATTPVRIESGALDPVTVTAPATVSPGEANVFTGTGTPGATFQVVNASGTVIVPGGPFTIADDGTWTFTRVVSAGAQDFRFAVQQTAFGKTETSALFTIPADTMRDVTVATTSAKAGRTNTFEGTATPGASYRVLNVSGTEIVSGGPFSVDRSGRWTFDRVVSTGATEFRFKLEQRLGDATTTSRLVSVPVG